MLDQHFIFYFECIKCAFLRILNDWQTLECYKSSYKKDTNVRIHCYVNRTQVVYLFTNNVKCGITISLTI